MHLNNYWDFEKKENTQTEFPKRGGREFLQDRKDFHRKENRMTLRGYTNIESVEKMLKVIV